jgi:uncharacterized protein (TIGR03083 family)
MTSTSLRQRETAALIETLARVGPRALTSCPGWSAQHVAAHIAGNHEEARRHVEAFAEGRPLTSTRTFEERETPLLARRFEVVLDQIECEEAALLTAVASVASTDPDAKLTWTGRIVPVKGFPTHMRSESAIHRWDIVGDDPASWELLADPELLTHAVNFIGRPLLGRGTAGGHVTFSGRIRSPGAGDLLVSVEAGRQPRLEVTEQRGEAVLETDAAARLLILWGRRPQPFHRLEASAGGSTVAQLQAILAGY